MVMLWKSNLSENDIEKIALFDNSKAKSKVKAKSNQSSKKNISEPEEG